MDRPISSISRPAEAYNPGRTRRRAYSTNSNAMYLVQPFVAGRSSTSSRSRPCGEGVWSDGAHISSLISAAGFICPQPSQLNVDRKLSAPPEAMRRRGLLATPNEAALLAAGEDTIDIIVSEILEGVAQYQDSEMLIMPQQAHLFQATAV